MSGREQHDPRSDVETHAMVSRPRSSSNGGLTPEQIALITRTVAKGATPDELELFFYAARRTGLDPLLRQIHAVKRWDRDQGRDVLTIQTGIDGLRLVAERTGRYAPGREPTFQHDSDGRLSAATAYVKKRTEDGTWHEVAATAHFAEYVQRRRDGQPTAFWQRMPHVMLAKCAESLALRRAFPTETSGLYSFEEMAQAGEPTPPPPEAESGPTITEAQAAELETRLEKTRADGRQFCEFFGINAVRDLPAAEYERAQKAVESKRRRKA